MFRADDEVSRVYVSRADLVVNLGADDDEAARSGGGVSGVG